MDLMRNPLINNINSALFFLIDSVYLQHLQIRMRKTGKFTRSFKLYPHLTDSSISTAIPTPKD